MRLIAASLIVVVLAATGCNRFGNSKPANGNGLTVEGPPPRIVVPSEPTVPPKKGAGISIGGIFKPIPQRTTEELIEEVEHPSTKDRLPLLAELAMRTKDKARLIPVLRRLLLDGRYSVRVLAAMTLIAVDRERPAQYATELHASLGGKGQMPVYGPIVEDTPELRKVRGMCVPHLVKILEMESVEINSVHEQTGGVLSILATMPAKIAEPAKNIVKRIATTPMDPNALFASELLKLWENAKE